MDKTLHTMVGAKDTIAFAAVTMVPDIDTMVFLTHTMVSIANTVVFFEREDLLDQENHGPGR